MTTQSSIKQPRQSGFRCLSLVGAAIAVWGVMGAGVHAGETTRVSVDSTGVQSNSHSFDSEISGNGRYVVFESYASNLVATDTNGVRDIFVHDRR